MSSVPNNTPGQAPITQEKLLEVIAKSKLSTTSNGCYGQICTLKVPNLRAGGHEMRAWDGVQRGSPAEEYLKKARGGLDPVRGDAWHFQQSASLKDGILLEVEGHVIGKLVGPVVGAASALMPIAKEAAKSAFRSASEAAIRAGKSASESANIATKAAGEAAVKTLNPAKKVVSDGVAILLKPSRVSTKPNTAHFWSGRSKDASGNLQGGAAKAEEIARTEGGKTLEMLIEERKIAMPNWDPTNPASVKAWQDISAEYAAGASGEVRAVIGNELRPGNIWETRELPALLNNPNVIRIIKIDPATGSSVQIYP